MLFRKQQKVLGSKKYLHWCEIVVLNCRKQKFFGTNKVSIMNRWSLWLANWNVIKWYVNASTAHIWTWILVPTDCSELAMFLCMFFPWNTTKLLSIIENNLEWNMKDHKEQGMLKSKNAPPKKIKNKKDVVHAKWSTQLTCNTYPKPLIFAC